MIVVIIHFLWEKIKIKSMQYGSAEYLVNLKVIEDVRMRQIDTRLRRNT